IEFGVDAPTALSYSYPHIKLPGGTVQRYNGTEFDSMIHKDTKEFYVVLEVTAVADGIDTLKVKGYRKDSTDVGFLKTVTGEISDKKVTYIGAGFDYCASYTKKNGVTRLNGVKVEYDNPHLAEKIEAAKSAQATEADIVAGFNALADYDGADKQDLIDAIKANATTPFDISIYNNFATDNYEIYANIW
ncbi:MAG: hypothetical protein IJP38_00110, partial [Oscillospiraceae bacterium]|nr:hypothetical protein [Oscillospiraceae bacterium]